MPADRHGTAADRLATLEADLRDLADRLHAEREEREAAAPAAPAEPAPHTPAAARAEPAVHAAPAAPVGPAAPAEAAAPAGRSRRRLSGAALLAVFLAPAVAAALAALLFADGDGDDQPRPAQEPRVPATATAPAPSRPSAALRLAADGPATARALRARGVFGVREGGRAQALAALCAGTTDVAVLRSTPGGDGRAPAAGCALTVAGEVPVAVTRVVAPLGGCLPAKRARGRASSPGRIDRARRRAARRAAPRALRRLRQASPVRGRDATVRRRVARQATAAATVAFDARRRLLPVAVRADGHTRPQAGGRGGSCVQPRATAIAAGTYPLTRRLVLATATARAQAPAARRLVSRLRAATPRARVRTVATFRAPEAP